MELRIDGWKSRIRFSASHFVPTHEKCDKLHGHDYAVHLLLEGEVDSSGMIMDFILLKKAMRKIVEELDHRVLLPGKSPLMKIKKGSTISISVGEKSYHFPSEDVRILDIGAVSAENLADYVLRKLTDEIGIPENVSSISVGVDEGPGQGAWASVTKRSA
ncbi:MAG: 6-pyruvoyl tetrahydropterin synthase family protein [Thermoplasmata archaeon]